MFGDTSGTTGTSEGNMTPFPIRYYMGYYERWWVKASVGTDTCKQMRMYGQKSRTQDGPPVVLIQCPSNLEFCP